MSKTFEQFVSEANERGGATNLLFEAGMYSLSNDLERILNVLRDAGVRFEVVGGVAVNAHIFLQNRSRSFVTRDIDLLLHRSDLERVTRAAEPLGYAAKKMMGGFMLIRPEQEAAELCLEEFDGARQRRLGDVAEFCGAREIALGADGQEISDLVHFHKARPLTRMWPIARKGPPSPIV